MSSQETTKYMDNMENSAKSGAKDEYELINSSALDDWDDIQTLFCAFEGDRISDRMTIELTGLIRGILVDGNVSRGEAAYLYDWCCNVQDTVQKEKASKPLRLFVETCLPVCNEIILGGDPNKLREVLERFGGRGSYKGCIDFVDPKEINFRSNFCLTGDFVWKSRTEIELLLESKGAKLFPKLVKEVDFLVVGDEATKSWATASYGRKIERAMQWRDAGQRIWIISEHAIRAAFETHSSYTADPTLRTVAVSLADHLPKANKDRRVWFTDKRGQQCSISLGQVETVAELGGTSIGPSKDGPWFPLEDGIALLHSIPAEERQNKRLTKLGIPIPLGCTYMQAKRLIREGEGFLPPTTDTLLRMSALGIRIDPTWNRNQCNDAMSRAHLQTDLKTNQH